MEKKRKKTTVKKKTKRSLNAQFLWLLLFAAAVYFFLRFWNLPMFPRKWSFYLLAATGLGLFLTGMLSSAARKNILVKGMDIGLTVCLLVGSVFLPYYSDRVTDLFNSVLGDQVRINLYAMAPSYQESHRVYFERVRTDTKLADYANDRFLTIGSLDEENNRFAESKLIDEFGSVDVTDGTSVYDAAAEFYQGRYEVLIVSEGYESIIKDYPGYEDFDEQTILLATFTRTLTDHASAKVDVPMTKKPFTVFLGGSDQEGELSLVGRTDVDMTVTVNPVTHQILVISYPRDSYVANPALGSKYDKLTHLGLSGIENTLDGVGRMLDMDIDNYFLINFTSFIRIIDALGGVDVENPYAFTYTWDANYRYPAGNIHLDGQAALYYVRERYNLPDGDFGRNMHQQIVLKAIIEKATSPTVIARFNSLLDSLDGAFLTNISTDSIYALCRRQLDENIRWDVITKSVEGELGFGECASVPGTELSIVRPDTAQMQEVIAMIAALNKGDILEKEEDED